MMPADASGLAAEGGIGQQVLGEGTVIPVGTSASIGAPPCFDSGWTVSIGHVPCLEIAVATMKSGLPNVSGIYCASALATRRRRRPGPDPGQPVGPERPASPRAGLPGSGRETPAQYGSVENMEHLALESQNPPLAQPAQHAAHVNGAQTKRLGDAAQTDRDQERRLNSSGGRCRNRSNRFAKNQRMRSSAVRLSTFSVVA